MCEHIHLDPPTKTDLLQIHNKLILKNAYHTFNIIIKFFI